MIFENEKFKENRMNNYCTSLPLLYYQDGDFPTIGFLLRAMVVSDNLAFNVVSRPVLVDLAKKEFLPWFPEVPALI